MAPKTVCRERYGQFKTIFMTNESKILVSSPYISFIVNENANLPGISE